MKQKIESVQIIVWATRFDDSEYPNGYIGVTRYDTQLHIGVYNNYWRAVGMQLRLAGFAKQVDNPSRSQ